MYPEETIVGNSLEVNIRVGMHDHHIASLEDSIDYCELLDMVLGTFANPVLLLEKAGHDWSKEVKARFPRILYSKISIKKLNPPLKARVENAEITVEKYYEE